MGGGPETGGAHEAYTPKPVTEAKNIQPLQPGFSMEKIQDSVKDAITSYGIKMRNASVDGAPAVALDFGSQIRLMVNWKQWAGNGTIAFDKDTLQIERYGLRQDWLNNPNAPLRLKSTNRDGTTDNLAFEKVLTANSPETNAEASKIDAYLANFETSPRNIKALMEDPVGKNQFDAIVRNWMEISDASAIKMKSIMRDYLSTYDGKGVNMATLPKDLKLTAAEKNGNPAFRVEGTPYVVYNGTEAPDVKKETASLKPGEIADPIETADGKNLKLVRNAAKDGYMDGNFGYRAIIMEGARYDVVPGSVRRLRDGGTTYSSFAGNGKKFDLHQPSTFSDKKPTIKEA